MMTNEHLQQALTLAFNAHKDQVDKAGAPYILHPMRLMFTFDDIRLKIIALLHDVIEDTALTESDLTNSGFSREIIDAIIALTRQNKESYQAFVERVAGNQLARQVKIADIQDNLDITRLLTVGDQDLSRLKKYHHALRFLESFEHSK